MNSNEDPKKRIGELIVEARESRKISQKELAEKLSITPGTMNKIEKGNQRLNADDLKKICVFLKVRPEYLLGIDRDRTEREHFVNSFLNQFSEVKTSWRPKDFDSMQFATDDFEEFLYHRPGGYIILTGPEGIFSYIKKVAESGKVGKRRGKDKECSYFLVSGTQLEAIVTERVEERLKLEKIKEEMEQQEET